MGQSFVTRWESRRIATHLLHLKGLGEKSTHTQTKNYTYQVKQKSKTTRPSSPFRRLVA